MRLLVDACVLYPTVLREIVLGYAAQGGFEPRWSARILEEWRRAALKNGPADGQIAEGEIALVKTRFPEAMVAPSPETQARLSLPDADDEHVLAAAIDSGADAILTLNLKDFPTRTLALHGLLRRDPDSLLAEAWHAEPETVRSVVAEVLDRAARHGIDTSNPRALMKRAKLPRLGKALFA